MRMIHLNMVEVDADVAVVIDLMDVAVVVDLVVVVEVMVMVAVLVYQPVRLHPKIVCMDKKKQTITHSS
jgi:hypothetical protein